MLVSPVATIFETVALGGAPWITQLRKLRYHFETPEHSLAPLFNTLATLSAVACIAYYAFAPAASVILFSSWWVLLLIALAAGTGFVILYIFNHDAVRQGTRRWPIIPALLAYIALFCFLSAAFGNLNVYADHHIISGQVVDDSTGQPLPDALVEIEFASGVVSEARCNDNGKYRLAIQKASVDSVQAVLASKNGFAPEEKQVFGPAASEYSFRLTPFKEGTS